MQYAVFLFVIVLFTFTACSTTSTSAALSTDEDVEKAIEARLNTDPELRTNIEVTANVALGEVTLSGNVETQELRSVAIEFATEMQPQLRVVDKIEVKPREVALADFTQSMALAVRDTAAAKGSKVGDSLEDAWIYNKITAELMGHEATHRSKINVDVMNKTVTLRGSAPTIDAQQQAERIAREVEGVNGVTNQLEVRE